MRLGLLLLAVLLGGCAEEAGRPALPGLPAPRETESAPHTMELTGCTGMNTAWAGDQEKLQGLLPDGYVSSGIGPLVTVGTDWQACARVLLDNVTLLEDVGLVLTSARLDDVPANRTQGKDAYLYEAFTTSEALAAWLRERGFSAEVGKVSCAAGPSATCMVEAANATYTFQTGPDIDRGPSEFDLSFRLHHSKEGHRVWADFVVSEERRQGLTAVEGTVAGGTAGVVAVPPGHVSGVAGFTSTHSLYVFG